jgi:ribosomal protein L11 methyltransferase
MSDWECRIVAFISGSSSKITAAALRHHFRNRNDADWKRVKRALTNLIESGTLCYTNHYGNSYIEISYDRLQCISTHLAVKPPSITHCPADAPIVVTLDRGAAFGGGDHPSTRLAVQLIDDLLHQPEWWSRRGSLQALDIGTGSGILALSAAALGVGSVRGLDNDPCAVFEARRNVCLNQREGQVAISGASLETHAGCYDLVFANLRTPTLIGLRDPLADRVASDSGMIFSGMKVEETGSVCRHYQESGYDVWKTRTDGAWSAVGLIRAPDSGQKP